MFGFEYGFDKYSLKVLPNKNRNMTGQFYSFLAFKLKIFF